MEFVDDMIDKKRLSKLVNDTYLVAGNKKTVIDSKLKEYVPMKDIICNEFK